jgi:hypothetical protein
MPIGTHYEYDAIKIKTAYGGNTISRFMAPGEAMGGKHECCDSTAEYTIQLA